MTKRISPFTAPGGGNQAKAHVYFFNNATPSSGALVAVSPSPDTSQTVKYTIANEQGVVSSDQSPRFVAESVSSLWAATRTGGTDASPTWSSSVSCTLVSDQAPPGIATSLSVVGTPGAPITDASTARPSGAVAVYWVCANGVTPTHAQSGDLIFNADA